MCPWLQSGVGFMASNPSFLFWSLFPHSSTFVSFPQPLLPLYLSPSLRSTFSPQQLSPCFIIRLLSPLSLSLPSFQPPVSSFIVLFVVSSALSSVLVKLAMCCLSACYTRDNPVNCTPVYHRSRPFYRTIVQKTSYIKLLVSSFKYITTSVMVELLNSPRLRENIP